MDILTSIYLYGYADVEWGTPQPAFADDAEKYGA